jgi:acetyl esterase/lipase
VVLLAGCGRCWTRSPHSGTARRSSPSRRRQRRVLAGPRLPVWLDAGDHDPFRPGDDAFAQALELVGADATVHAWPGEHDGEYWDPHRRDCPRCYARALRRD